MSTKSKTATSSESSTDTQPVVAQFTVSADSNFGQFAWDVSQQVSAEEYKALANDGFKARIAAVTSKLDGVFGNFGHKGANGKIVTRPDGKDGRPEYKRGGVQFNTDNAETIRKAIATSDSQGRSIACTVTRYVPTVSVTLDQAAVVMAKNKIVAKSTDGNTLRVFAQTVGYEGDDLSVNNEDFVSKTAEFLASL